jgi:hypothetical protein
MRAHNVDPDALPVPRTTLSYRARWVIFRLPPTLIVFAVDAPQGHRVGAANALAIYLGPSRQTPNDQVHRARATAAR